MKKWVTRALAMAWMAAGLSLLLSACDRKEEMGPEVLVKVNDDTVSTLDLQRAWLSLTPAERQNYGGPQGLLKLLDELITWKLMAQEAKARHLDEDPGVQQMMKMYEQQLLVNALLNRAVTDADIYKYYQEHFLRGRLIMVGFSGDGAQKEKAEAEAGQIYSELQNGADFGELAKTRSDSKFAERGGDLGYVTHEVVTNLAGFDAAESLFALKDPGTYTKPLQGVDGYYIFQIVEPPGNLNPAHLSPQFKNAVRDTKKKEVIRSFANELESRPDNKVERNLEAVRVLVEKLQKSQESMDSVSPGSTAEPGDTAGPGTPVSPGGTAQGSTAREKP